MEWNRACAFDSLVYYKTLRRSGDESWIVQRSTNTYLAERTKKEHQNLNGVCLLMHGS